MPGIPVMAILLAGVALLVIPLWRSATNLEGHVRAGAQVILEALAAQSATSAPAPAGAAAPQAPSTLLPGLGNATAVAIAAGSPAVGRTLKQINLRGLTGATVIAIDRESADVIYPTGDEELRAGDALIVTGNAEAVQAAQELVAAAPAPAGYAYPADLSLALAMVAILLRPLPARSVRISSPAGWRRSTRMKPTW